jgi:nucleoside-diphosphate-sugar epimerase
VYKGLNYYTFGSSGYVTVYDVVFAMLQLMNNKITNERYILVSENITFKLFSEKLANVMNVTPAKKELKSWQLQLAWRIDWLSHKLFGKRRRLSRQLAKTLSTKANYDNTKIKNELNFEFLSIDQAIHDIAAYFLKDMKAKSGEK